MQLHPFFLLFLLPTTILQYIHCTDAAIAAATPPPQSLPLRRRRSAAPRAAAVAAAAAVVVVSLDRPKMESSSRKPSCPSFSFNCTKTRRGKSILQLAACSLLLTSQKPLFLCLCYTAAGTQRFNTLGWFFRKNNAKNI